MHVDSYYAVLHVPEDADASVIRHAYRALPVRYDWSADYRGKASVVYGHKSLNWSPGIFRHSARNMGLVLSRCPHNSERLWSHSLRERLSTVSACLCSKASECQTLSFTRCCVVWVSRTCLTNPAMGAITFCEVVVSHERCTASLLFHELVHVEQYPHLGIPCFSELYTRGFLNGGSYEAIPLEGNAYSLTDRFRRDPRRGFSVQAEVAQWLADVRLWLPRTIFCKASGTFPSLMRLPRRNGTRPRTFRPDST
jgi:hypothetical protein